MGRNLIQRIMNHTQTVQLNRKRAALSQEELADLIDVSQSTISRVESDETVKMTTLETLLGLQVVFGHSPRALFSSLYAKIEEAVMTRAAELDCLIRSKDDPQSLKKKQLLSAMMKRATSQSPKL
jgi:transcriptional regulator with XRE-family HTH domain